MRHDTQHEDIQNKYTLHNNIWHNVVSCDTQGKDTQH